MFTSCRFLQCLTVAVLLSLSACAFADDNKPIAPLGKDGKPLNFDFEDGTLKDWTATGTAFDKQPIKGDTVFPRRNQHSNHHGNYWIGGFELLGDDAVGTLTSIPFKASHRWASFLFAGGTWAETRVELVTADDNKVFFKSSGAEDETLRPVIVDLEKQLGKDIIIRLVDDRKGGWGHVNFDDFEFYEQRPKINNEMAAAAPLVHDEFKFAGLTPEKAAEAMTLPEGFKAQLFAGEPDVVQPIAFTIDSRGRIWVVEGMTYPVRAPEGKGQDRILVLEDEKGDGHFTKRTVFMEGLNLVSGIEVGFGGVYIGAAPYLMFIPADINADTPKPSGDPQILLDGWGHHDTHETLNTFCWGPDGWLYGCHGVFTQSDVGKPGTPPADRVHVNCGVWRYHPTQHIFELFSEGTSNPWGVDFDDHGQCIIEACVIPHLWHMIQGGHYQRQGGDHDNKFVFDDIKTIADHLHYAGSGGPHAGNGKSSSAGGGHAHAGFMCYLGGSWPAEYTGQYFMNNIHGARINVDVPEAKGSGIVGHHGKDFILFNDQWSQIINLRYDQDGSMYMIDWYDKNQCHSNDAKAHDRTNGRVFKVVYGDTKTTKVDLSKLSDAELVKLQLSKNDWNVRTARRVLQERQALGKLTPDANKSLVDILQNNPDESRKLRALWALNCTGGLTPELLAQQLKSDKQFVVAWAIQLLTEGKTASAGVVQEFAKLAKDSPSAVVRLYLASAMQRLPFEQRWDVVTNLVSHVEDADDHNLPLMDWYALEPLCPKDPDRALALAAQSKLPRMLSFAVRRISGSEGDVIPRLVKALGQADDAGRQLEILRGIRESLRGQRAVEMPKEWKEIEPKLAKSSDAAVRAQSSGLAVTFGSADAIAAARTLIVDGRRAYADRQNALDSLLGIKDAALVETLQKLLVDPPMRGPALRGLAAYDDPNTAKAILTAYASFTPAEKKDALSTLASRLSSAKELLGAIGSNAVASKDVSADVVRQLRSLKNADIDAQVAKVWGVLRESPEDKKARIAQLKTLLQTAKATDDPSRGRRLFSNNCQQCHSLYETGGHVGPDLTGSNRADLDYLLENVVDPNAVIPNDYRTTEIETKDGRVVLGIIKREDDKSLTIVMPNEDLVLPKNEIKERTLRTMSMMPEGLLDSLPEQDIRDLAAYLRGKAQVPIAP